MKLDDNSQELARTREQLDSALRELGQLRRQRDEASSAERQSTGELQHRMRNLLAIVRSVFTRTMETTTSLEEASNHFQGRLDTLARHEIRSLRDLRGTADLEGMVRDELLRFGFSDGPRIIFEGPAIGLPYEVAEGFGLALHELATNSVKFGALASDRGHLDIRWRQNERSNGSDLAFEWTETKVAIVTSAPLRIGFGREYIEAALPYQLNAMTSFELQPGGLRCRIEIPFGKGEDE